MIHSTNPLRIRTKLFSWSWNFEVWWFLRLRKSALSNLKIVSQISGKLFDSSPKNSSNESRSWAGLIGRFFQKLQAFSEYLKFTSNGVTNVSRLEVTFFSFSTLIFGFSSIISWSSVILNISIISNLIVSRVSTFPDLNMLLMSA